MSSLTAKQREELNLAIYEYMKKHKFTQAASLFADEASLDVDSGPG